MCGAALEYEYDPETGEYLTVNNRIHHRDTEDICSYSNLPSVSSYSE